ncbi:MAG: ABC transporter ATP-binding protein [Deltaproteobacteria bacterium]|nr:ABC transporter ATP-binding protein [Deltaproteobacteria bacterium]
MLSIEGVRKSFNGREILHGIDLSLGKEKMASVMGKSGSGKSTLLAIMAGLLRPDDGKVLYGDFDIGTADEDTLAEFRLKTIGFIFQDFKLIPSLTVHDNILLGIYPRKDVDEAEKQRRIQALAEEVGLCDRLKEQVNNLSGGEKQRVAIARSLVNQPAVVLADEPTGNLDSKTADGIMALFQRLHQKHETSFLIVTHDQDIAAKTEHIYRIQDGELMS